MASTGSSPLEVTTNAYGDLQLRGQLPTDAEAFQQLLRKHVADSKRGVWLQIPFDAAHANLLHPAFDLGFRVHHAYKGVLTLQRWNAPFENPTPPYGHHAYGSAAIVVNAKGQFLGIHEKFDRSGKWNAPGGHVDEGEDLITAAVREAWEETGVTAVPLGILTFTELQLPVLPPPSHTITADDRAKMEQSMRFGSTNMAAFVLCYASNSSIKFDPEEISEAAWISGEEFEEGARDMEASLARYLRMSGKLPAIATLAGLPENSPLKPELVSRVQEGLVLGYSAGMPHRRFDSTFETVYYNSLAPHTFQACLPSAVSNVRILGAPGANTIAGRFRKLTSLPPIYKGAAVVAAVGVSFILGLWLGGRVRKTA